jgi:hypothetical protein
LAGAGQNTESAGEAIIQAGGVPMSAQRLSKLQKWILENCFRVTVLFDRTTLKTLNAVGNSRKCRECLKTKESVRLIKGRHTLDYECLKEGFSCSYFVFYKEDILRSFFSLPPDNMKSHFSRVQHFHDSSNYAKAHVTTLRSISSLADKGLIYACKVFREDSVTISLTDEGMNKAAELLKIEDFKSPKEA